MEQPSFLDPGDSSTPNVPAPPIARRRGRERPAVGYGGGTWARLLLMVGFLVVIIASFDRVRDPAFWAALFPGLTVDTELSPELAVDIAGNPVPPPNEPAPRRPAGEPTFNPLNLVQTNECAELDRQTIQEAVRDKTGRRAEETLVIQQLLCRAATTPPAELVRQSRRDLLFSNLVQDPDRYRGVPVHRRGVLRTLSLHETDADRHPYGLARYYQGWMFTEDQPSNPTVVLFSKLPEGLAPGVNLSVEVSIDAFFLKLFAYRSEDGKNRFAPMLVGYEPVLAPTGYRLGDGLLQTLGVILLVAFVSGGYILWQRWQDRQLVAQLGKKPAPRDPFTETDSTSSSEFTNP